MKAPDPGVGLVSSMAREVGERESDKFTRFLFTEVRPGQAMKAGPDSRGRWFVYKLLDYIGERSMSYEEVEPIVDESVQNLEAQRLLDALLGRLRKRFQIEEHPEHVMRIHLVDPLGEA